MHENEISISIAYTRYIAGIYCLSEYTWYIRGIYLLYTSSGFQMVENLRPEANFCRQVREAAEEAYFIQNKDEISKRLRVGDRAVLLAFA
jgi:hypothetical protein